MLTILWRKQTNFPKRTLHRGGAVGFRNGISDRFCRVQKIQRIRKIGEVVSHPNERVGEDPQEVCVSEETKQGCWLMHYGGAPFSQQ